LQHRHDALDEPPATLGQAGHLRVGRRALKYNCVSGHFKRALYPEGNTAIVPSFQPPMARSVFKLGFF
jgi:hypothetical protein